MVKIKKLNLFNRSKIKKMTPFINKIRNNTFLNMLSSTPIAFIHNMLPQKYKFMDESYILSDNGDNEAMVTVSPIVSNPYKLIIARLFFMEHSYEYARELINSVVADYGEKGVFAFYVTINQVYEELIQMFLSGCGFRKCSSEQIWEVKKNSFRRSKSIKYRRFRESDLDKISDIYNDSLITHFRPTLERSKEEFSEFLCNGLTHSTEYRYVIEDSSSDKVIGYFLIVTNDNRNYVVDFNYSDGYDVDFDGIMYYATREILKRIRRFKLHLKIKNYLKTGEKQQEYVQSKRFTCTQTKVMLVKDFYRLVKEKSNDKIMARETVNI